MNPTPIPNPESQLATVANLLPADADRIERIKSYHQNCLSAFGKQMGFAFLAGLELNAAKEAVTRGQFMKWVERHLPEIPHRTATRYMGFAEAISPQLATVANFNPERLQLTNGDLPEKEKAEVLAAVHEAADGKTLTQLYRDMGLIRDPKDPNAGDKKTPEQLTPEQQLQAWKERDTAVLQQAIDLMRSLITPDEERPRYFEKETRKAAQQLSIEFTKFLKRGSKEKKPSKAEQKQAAANEAARKEAERRAKLAKVKAETGMDVDTQHPEWPWFWGYKNRWGTIKLEPFKGADDHRACNEARLSPSILVVIGAFQAETWSDGEKELTRLIAANPPLPGRVEEKPITEKQSAKKAAQLEARLAKEKELHDIGEAYEAKHKTKPTAECRAKLAAAARTRWAKADKLPSEKKGSR